MKRQHILWVLSICLMLLAPSVMASTSSNGWEIYTLTGGGAIAELLRAASKVVGSSPFQTLMVAVGTIGFLVLAAIAGMDPGKGFVKAVGYLLTVYLVFMVGCRITVPVVLIDKVERAKFLFDTTAGNAYSYQSQTTGFSLNVSTGANGAPCSKSTDKNGFVSVGCANASFDYQKVFDSIIVYDVPMILAVPASVASKFGEYLTRAIELNLSIPAELSLAKQDEANGIAVLPGGFNLAANIINDSLRLRITDPNLKTNLSNYMKDCWLNQLAINKTGGWSGNTDQATSVAVLYTSKRIWSDLAITNNVLSTKLTFDAARYTTMSQMMTSASDAIGSNSGASDAAKAMKSRLDDAITGLGGYFTPSSTAPVQTITTSCDKAYVFLTSYMGLFANGLLAAKEASQWSNTGIYASVAQGFMAANNWIGNTAVDNPGDAIKQYTMMNFVRSDLSSIASDMGGNTTQVAMAAAQATQAQKMQWGSAAVIFSNLMGYVFTTLQGFMMAVMPFVLLGMIVPGFGVKLGASFFKIFLWLALWQPMLAVVNFMVYKFGQGQLQPVLGSVSPTGGPAVSGMADAEESAQNLKLAASFLGTSVPLIAWQLVSGTMAFTEFIQHGIGGSFAGQAGMQAATGNVNLNNMSMDNMSANKRDTSMSVEDGYKGVTMHNSAGATTTMSNAGGAAATLNGGAVTNSWSTNDGFSKQQALADQQALNRAAQKTESTTVSDGKGHETAKAEAAAKALSSSVKDVLSGSHGTSVDGAKGEGSGRSTNESLDLARIAGNFIAPGKDGKPAPSVPAAAVQQAQEGAEAVAGGMASLRGLGKNGEGAKLADQIEAKQREINNVPGIKTVEGQKKAAALQKEMDGLVKDAEALEKKETGKSGAVSQIRGGLSKILSGASVSGSAHHSKDDTYKQVVSEAFKSSHDRSSGSDNTARSEVSKRDSASHTEQASDQRSNSTSGTEGRTSSSTLAASSGENRNLGGNYGSGMATAKDIAYRSASFGGRSKARQAALGDGAAAVGQQVTGMLNTNDARFDSIKAQSKAMQGAQEKELAAEKAAVGSAQLGTDPKNPTGAVNDLTIAGEKERAQMSATAQAKEAVGDTLKNIGSWSKEQLQEFINKGPADLQGMAREEMAKRFPNGVDPK